MFLKADEGPVWAEIDSARKKLSDYLRTLQPTDWNHTSLCDDWRVRDVVAHLVIEYRYDWRHDWKDFVRSGLRVNAFLRDTAIARGDKPTADLLSDFSGLYGDRGVPRGGSVCNVLVDLLVHEQDIRVPLGSYKAMPKPALELLFRYWQPGRFNTGERAVGLATRLRGLKLRCTDIPFTSGDGELVEGTAQDILLAATGRSFALDELRGSGVSLLRERLK